MLVGGIPGTGKSTVAGHIASRCGMVVLSSDRIRKELAGSLRCDRPRRAHPPMTVSCSLSDPELYPTVVRGSGFGAASGMSRIGGVVAPIVGGALLPGSLLAPLLVYAAAFVLAAASVAVLGTETRGRSLGDLLTAGGGGR